MLTVVLATNQKYPIFRGWVIQINRKFLHRAGGRLNYSPQATNDWPHVAITTNVLVYCTTMDSYTSVLKHSSSRIILQNKNRQQISCHNKWHGRISVADVPLGVGVRLVRLSRPRPPRQLHVVRVVR